MKILKIIPYFIFVLIITSCNSKRSDIKNSDPQKEEKEIKNTPRGKLFIIGGGKRPPQLIKELINISGLKKEKHCVILPMASQEPDSAIFYASRQFIDLSIDPNKIKGYNFKKDEENEEGLEAIRKAGLIYISGGDQRRFMSAVLNTPVYNAIHEAYQNGATIAGTSAGAAVMGKEMITGDEFKHPEYTGDFRTIEADNIEIVEGMGLLKNTIIDQHFIKRMRMNRLISIALEYPLQTAIGIDESTAIVIQGDSARVTGVSQVILLRNPKKSSAKKDGLLGGDQLELSVKLPGSTFAL